jgi:hypothetical protein
MNKKPISKDSKRITTKQAGKSGCLKFEFKKHNYQTGGKIRLFEV